MEGNGSRLFSVFTHFDNNENFHVMKNVEFRLLWTFYDKEEFRIVP